MLKLKREGIPEELKIQNKWVVFEITPEGGKTPKDPKPENLGENAKINNPSTWGSFEQAASLVEQGLYPALGYAMVKGDKLIFVDVDCHDEKCSTKEEKDALRKKYESMRKLVETYGSYMEQSISGTGVHLLARGVLSEELAKGQSKVMPVEIYDSKFIIMTGHRLNDYDIEDNPRTLGAIHNLHKANFQPIAPRVGSADKPLIPPIEIPIRSDEEVLKIALNETDFELLWNGQWDMIDDKDGNQKYSQQHYADMVLMRKICFYSGNCPTQIERLFRKSPCYQQYGKNGKWEKYERDIRKDLKTVTTTCYAVYDPEYKKNNKCVAVVETEKKAVDIAMGLPLVNPLEWKPDFADIKRILNDPEECPFDSQALVNVLKDYIYKNRYKEVFYYPNLFKEDRNVNGGTAIVQRVLGDNFKFSYNFGNYFLWKGKKYEAAEDPEVLIHPITEALGLVEHSVFEWTMNYVANYKNPEPVETSEGNTDSSKKEKTPKDYLEEKALKLFEQSKKYVSRTLAQDILKKYKGMSIGDDIVTYYETPYINMQNGMLNVKTREFLPYHDPKYNLYKITNCDYDPNAQCPEFEAMMERLIPDQAERKEVQKAFGVCLAKEQIPAKKMFVMFTGPKDSGKSFLLNTLVDTLGDYADAVDNSLLMQTGRDKTVGPEMYAFKDTLMITASETDDSKDKLDTSRIKGMSGNTTQSIRNNFAKKMDKFKVIGIIYIDCNEKAYLNPRDTAALDRLRLFKLPNPIKVFDLDLKDKLAAERAGIFNWLLKGLDMVLEEKAIFETPEMLKRKQEYKSEMDVADQFLRDCIEAVEDKHFKEPTTLLFVTYKNWCQDNNFKPSVRNKFYEDMQKHFEKKKSGSEFFVGLKFTELGSLYSVMNEYTQQQFAKKKRELLVGSNSGLPYRTIRVAHFKNTMGWFYLVNERMDRSSYISYCSWCAEEGKVPINVEDFVVKLEYLKKHLYDKKALREYVNEAAEIWSD